MPVAAASWKNVWPGDPEATEWTEKMMETVRGLAPDGSQTADDGTELRVRLDDGRLFCFLGQAASSGGIAQGASIQRILRWRSLTPLTFVAVQGPSAWLLTLPSSSFPMTRKIAEHARFGWNVDEMLKVRLYGEPREDQVPFTWDLEHELRPSRDSLGDQLF